MEENETGDREADGEISWSNYVSLTTFCQLKAKNKETD